MLGAVTVTSTERVNTLSIALRYAILWSWLDSLSQNAGAELVRAAKVLLLFVQNANLVVLSVLSLVVRPCAAFMTGSCDVLTVS